MKLDHHIKGLIAVGAAVGTNCQPCLQTATAFALENGSDPSEIAEAIAVGKRVRAGAASKMDQIIASLENIPSTFDAVGACGCHSRERSK